MFLAGGQSGLAKRDTDSNIDVTRSSNCLDMIVERVESIVRSASSTSIFDFGKMVPDPSSGGGGGKDTTTACDAIRGAKRPLRGSVNDTRVKWLYHHGDRVTKRRDVEERRERLAFRRRWLIHHGLR